MLCLRGIFLFILHNILYYIPFAIFLPNNKTAHKLRQYQKSPAIFLVPRNIEIYVYEPINSYINN